MRESVFVDTSAWYALANNNDANHAEASSILSRLVQRRWMLITTNHVAAETYTLVRARLGFGTAQGFLHRIKSSAAVQRVFVPERWEEAAEDLLARYDDQDFSYTDATSFVTMHRLELQAFFAFDHHFVVAGFVPVDVEG